MENIQFDITNDSVLIHIMSKVGDNIRKARLAKNYKQTYMANLLGISAHAYGDIERGISDINMNRLQKIADILEVTPQELITSGETLHINANQTTNSSIGIHNHNVIGVSEEMFKNLTQVLTELCVLLKDLKKN